MPTLSAIGWTKHLFAAGLCLLVCACLALSASADTLTVTAGTVSGGDLMATLTKAKYISALPDEPSSSYSQTFDLSPATLADGSSLGDGFEAIKLGSVPPNAVADGSYFYQLDFGGLNFEHKKVNQ